MSGWLKQLLNPKTAGKVKEVLESTIKKVNPKLGFEDTKAYKQKLKMNKFLKK
jgi:pyruvate/2-oxoglutarate/acetoin dehydrogenase E1 component|tara:strand:+ start:103 stop:261 length:159 start_codon:yes stop_codon:yes gene_type:complete